MRNPVSRNRKWRRRAAVVTALSFALIGASEQPGGTAPPRRRIAPAPTAGMLQLSYRSPVLIGEGERVRIPVDAFCLTSTGKSCTATITLSFETGEGGGTAEAAARPGLRFDLTAPAARAADGADGALSFRLHARSSETGALAVPAPEQGPLRLYVAGDMASTSAPAGSFGRTQQGTTVLYLPWGTGSQRAGLAPGYEAPTLGPPSFDLDDEGRIYVVDALQSRVAVFSRGQLVQETAVPRAAATDVAVADDGTAFVGSQAPGPGGVAVRTIAPNGTFGPPSVVPGDVFEEIHTDGERGYVHALPADAWEAVDDPELVTTGRPLGRGSMLLKSVVGNAVRLGLVSDGQVRDAVEVRFDVPLGELAMAEPDGQGGYYAVVHVWRESPAPMDQYQVLHVMPDGSARGFAVPDQSFADAMPLARFRLGADGALYQLTTSPDGMRIVRYDLGGTR